MGLKAPQRSKASMIGEKQWIWLEASYKSRRNKSNRVSLQFLADFTGWESWLTFLLIRKRLTD